MSEWCLQQPSANFSLETNWLRLKLLLGCCLEMPFTALKGVDLQSCELKFSSVRCIRDESSLQLNIIKNIVTLRGFTCSRARFSSSTCLCNISALSSASSACCCKTLIFLFTASMLFVPAIFFFFSPSFFKSSVINESGLYPPEP